MLLSIVTVAIALFFAAGLFAVGVAAYRQNLPLLQNFRQGNRNFKSIFGQALRVWSPMAVVILLLLCAASAISQGITELAYRYTTLDEFCAVRGIDSTIYVACTGLGDELAASEVVQLNPAKDLQRQIFIRYSNARKRILDASLDELKAKARNRSAFLHTLLPSGVLALPPGIEGDITLSRLVTGRRRVFESPIPKPTGLVELMSYRQSVDTRNRLLKEMDAKIATRRKTLLIMEYGTLTPAQRTLHQRRNSVLQLMDQVKADVDPDVQAILSAPANNTAANAYLLKQGLVRMLAHSERDAWKILAPELGSRGQASVVYDLLGMMPRCTIAKKNSQLRMGSSDFETYFSNSGVPDDLSSTIINGGSFPCFSKSGTSGSWKLASVGFRKSVLLSIDRMRDDAAFSAFETLDVLEGKAETGAVDTETATRMLAKLIPDVIPLGRQKCGVLHPVNCVMNGIAGSAEVAYTNSRAELLTQYLVQTKSTADIAAMSIQQKIDYARVTTDAEISRMHAAGYVTAESFFKLNDLMRVLGWIGLLLIALRSFLYVFALELFDKNGESRISFDVENPVEGNYVAGSEVTIDAEFPLPIINRGSLTNTLADIKFAPWRWSSPVTRILHGRYFLFNWSVFSPPKLKAGAEDVKGMEASARRGYSIVEWRMQPGEEVIFNYKDFYGASVNVQLKTDISLRLSTLLLGKIFFHYAHCSGGEGRLLLEARIHNTPRDSMSSIKPARLLAWNRHAQFSADSHRQPWKTLINPYTIVREYTPGVAKGLVIIAPENESAQFFGMGVQFLKRIFSRIF
ncbi:MAG: hypothetical protein ABI644_08580 [Arenimonas sp.]